MPESQQDWGGGAGRNPPPFKKLLNLHSKVTENIEYRKHIKMLTLWKRQSYGSVLHEDIFDLIIIRYIYSKVNQQRHS